MWGIFTSTPDTLISSAGRLKPYNLRAALYMALAIFPLALLSPVKISSKTIGQVILFKVSSQSTFLLAARAEWCMAPKAWCGLALAGLLALKQSSGSFGTLSSLLQMVPIFCPPFNKVWSK